MVVESAGRGWQAVERSGTWWEILGVGTSNEVMRCEVLGMGKSWCTGATCKAWYDRMRWEIE